MLHALFFLLSAAIAIVDADAVACELAGWLADVSCSSCCYLVVGLFNSYELRVSGAGLVF